MGAWRRYFWDDMAFASRSHPEMGFEAVYLSSVDFGAKELADYHVPHHTQEHVDYIISGIKLFAPVKRSLSRNGFRDISIQPDSKADLPSLWPVTSRSATSGLLLPVLKLFTKFPRLLATPTEDHDLDSFFSNLTSIIPNGTHPNLASIDGGTAPTDTWDGGGESALGLTLAYPLFNTFLDALDGSYCSYSAFGETGNDPQLDPVNPNTIDIEGAYKGDLMCGVYQLKISSDLWELFTKLGLQGVSLPCASGDSSVGGPRSSDREMCLGPKNTIFKPAWPKNCPYITNVGSTKALPKPHSPRARSSLQRSPKTSRTAWPIPPGAGSSNLYPAPDDQKRALATYFRKHDPWYRC
ncbi:aorsin [Drepanopeziza brunnea f. sp. 'multigermtubi' MB_m1]|uniref:Aorsin n=1 Tax=Marssonina brunnea f. sp. multigermtubi (strain MB_m1) TaxID=1072389 RepID=K1WL38_MARBU|nr:aorsin [Drepanopeziza brunnea f. sp. 'multigermtubi' MB_m1]EKD13551.1 aorsin [Drepanopeziza brunnea f. sp. 'multigermtubi' MB_m1]